MTIYMDSSVARAWSYSMKGATDPHKWYLPTVSKEKK